MPDLTNFLLARITEDEELAQATIVSGGWLRFVLAECETKRRIVDWCRHVEVFPASRVADGVLRLLALPYADHPDFDPSWRVQ